MIQDKKIIQTIVIAGAIALIGYMALLRADKYIDVTNRKLLNEAVDQCSQNSKYIFDNGSGVKTEEPIKANYEQCMAEKGYR